MITGSRKAKINMRTCSLCKTLFKMLLNWTNMNQSLALCQVFSPTQRTKPSIFVQTRRATSISFTSAQQQSPAEEGWTPVKQTQGKGRTSLGDSERYKETFASVARLR